MQLSSPNMKLQTVKLAETYDKDFKTAFALQLRANELFRGTDKYVQAWKEACKTLVTKLKSVDDYAKELREFLDGLREKESEGPSPTPSSQSSAGSVGTKRRMTPPPTPRTVSKATPQPTPQSTAQWTPVPLLPPTPQPSNAATVVSLSTRPPTPQQPTDSNKRKADVIILDDSDEEIVKIAAALRKGRKKARIENELRKYNLSLGALATQVKIRKEEEPQVELEEYDFH
ncbi:uncharacterized protein RCC_00042 [Ramularia collo-cygni]|uniref:Uncharacterized protein n=1 Tax=Ramularia collo-cygni TaxID=112498 RepID=A0A2D3URI3_9PEZI|nr:uncharacterized protein RCC_00042 [Ramularia collo-cygni]CZT14067.1 uncharacterized protein RCC_00042 [Ramularia collo-cygni]